MKKDDPLVIKNVLYSVDPAKLHVKEFDTTRTSIQHGTTTTHECFAIKHEDKSFAITNDKYPFEVNGVYYFKTKEEALNFIKMQIGM